MPEPLYYLGLLLLSLCGLAVLDRRFRLAYFAEKTRTIKTIAVGLLVFIAWDLAGIGLGIFRIGDSPYLTGIRLAPDFPLEELFFLALLLYATLLAWRAGEPVMATYIALSVLVLTAISITALTRIHTVFTRATLAALILLVLLTAVFDNLIIMADIVAYDTALIIGAYIGQAPIEDFAYTIGAVLLVPLLWSWSGEES